MPIYRDESNIADNEKVVVSVGTGLPRETGGGVGGGRRRWVWRIGWGKGREGI